MRRRSAVALLLLVTSSVVALTEPASRQGEIASQSQASLGVLRIRVVVIDSAQQSMPVPRHALLISDNPASALPRRILTALDGSVEVRLPPGNYTVESDRPFTLDEKAYSWTQIVDVTAGREAVLELTSANADVEANPSAPNTAGAPERADPSSSRSRWEESVVAIWTPVNRASGVLIDANGLIVTSQRVIGTASTVEVQLTPTVKVAGSVLVADPLRDVAVLRIDPTVAASLPAMPLGCGQAPPSLVVGEEIFALEAPLRGPKGSTSGIVSRVRGSGIDSDLLPAVGGIGGPVFTEAGAVVGITSVVDERDRSRDVDTHIVRVGNVCDIVAVAQTRLKDAAPPKATHLPVEPLESWPEATLADIVRRRAGSLNPYVMSSSDFDIALMTPVQLFAAQDRDRPMSGNTNARPAMAQALVSPLSNFSHWADYVVGLPPVLLIRATPRLVEGFWTKVARGAASTQGVALPPLKRPKSGFSRMRAFCGDTEITPIHPFRLEQRLSDDDAIYEGLYVFDPDALQPSCASVKLMLYSEKEPEKADTRVVDAKVVRQIWQDFESYRASRQGAR